MKAWWTLWLTITAVEILLGGFIVRHGLFEDRPTLLMRVIVIGSGAMLITKSLKRAQLMFRNNKHTHARRLHRN